MLPEFTGGSVHTAVKRTARAVPAKTAPYKQVKFLKSYAH